MAGNATNGQNRYVLTVIASTGWQGGGLPNVWFRLPDCRVASPCLGQLHYYCTSGDSKDGPPKQMPVNVPSTEKVLSGKTLLFINNLNLAVWS